VQKHFTSFRLNTCSRPDQLSSTKKVNLVPTKNKLFNDNEFTESGPLLFKSKFNSTKHLDESYESIQENLSSKNDCLNSLQNWSHDDIQREPTDEGQVGFKESNFMEDSYNYNVVNFNSNNSNPIPSSNEHKSVSGTNEV